MFEEDFSCNFDTAVQIESDHGVESFKEDDVAEKMPVEFYVQVDEFLKSSPPVFQPPKEILKATKKALKSEISKVPGKLNSFNLKPTANPGKSKSKSRNLDPQLLKEAFEYTDKLLKDFVTEEQQADVQARNPDIHRRFERENYDHADGGNQIPIQNRGMTHVGIVRKLKSNRSNAVKMPSKTNLNSEPFKVSGGSEVDARKNVLDFNELVSNFQNGTTLSDSKISLATSEKAIRSMSESWGMSNRGKLY